MFMRLLDRPFPVPARLHLLIACLILAGLQTAQARLDIRPALEAGGADGPLRFEIEFPELLHGQEQLGGITWDLLAMEGAGWIGQPGAPDLPALQQLIEIPDRSDIQLRILEEVSEPLRGLQPLPCQERLHTEAELPLPWLEDAEIYLADELWPGRVFELDEPALLRNRRVVKASFFPVQVNPLTGEGRVIRRLSVEITFDGENPVNTRDFVINDPTPVLRTGIAPMIFNPQVAVDGALREDVYPNPGRLPGHYLMFAKNAAQNVAAFQDYVDWKRKRGHKVTLVSETDISFTTTAIRNRIIAEYQSDDPVDFVLLVGDTEGSFSIPTDGPSYDHFYAKIEGNDILGDVAVGRLSCDNATQLTTICNKITQYESTPYTEDPSWLTHGAFTVGSSACYLSMKQISRNIAAELVESRGFTDIDTFFCAGSGHVVGVFNSGTSLYNYRGWIGMEGLSFNTLLNLSQGPRTPVVTLFTCSTGDFQSGDDYVEAALMAGNPAVPGGAVACMGFATSSTHTRYNNVVNGGYYNCLIEHDIPEVGICLLHGKYELHMTLPPGDQGSASNFANWANLMGDPGTVQWAGLLGVLEIDAPASLSPGEGALMLTVTNENGPVAEAAVALWQPRDAGEDLQSMALTGADGVAFLPWAALEAGTVHLTVTHRRNEPLLLELPVAAADTDAALALESVEGGGLLPGASGQSLSVRLENTGSNDLTGISVQLDLDPAYGTLSTLSLSPEDLPAGQSLVLGPILINPADDLVDRDIVPMELTVQAAAGSLSRMVALPVVAPALLPTSQSTPFGALEPGETRTLRIAVQNAGQLEGGSLIGHLTCNTPFYGQVATPPLELGSLAPGESTNADFEITVSTEAVIGFPLPLTLTWTSAAGSTGQFQVQATVGTPSQGDPTGPDEYGYWAYESQDSNYTLAPAYEWIPITSFEGGPGTELTGIQDNGDEQDDGEWVDLPFTFSFYGESYTRAFVCSNGFISLAENGFRETDFRNHYLPTGMGPDAMIAPMWDDHMTTGNAGVWYWHDTEQSRFVITWWACPANQSGGPNTFQLALYDPVAHPTVTGDGPILFQYHTFNDNQSAWTDFDYCSVGIKDHTSTRGLTLLNAHQRPATMHPIAANRAIFWTTMVSTALTPPDISLSESSIELEVMQGGTVRDSLVVRNDGEMPLIWAAHLLDGPRDSGGPDNFGYVWVDNGEPNGPVFDWLESAEAQDIIFANHDSLSAPMEPGFTMHVYGRAFESFRISPNGYIVFGADEGTSHNLELPHEDAPGWIIAPWWDDLKPDANEPGQVQYWSDGVGEAVVSWNAVSHFNPFIYGGPVSAQLRLRAGGEILLQVADTGGDAYPVNASGTVGIHGLPGTEGLSFFHNEDVSERLPWAVRITPPAWVELHGATSGTLAAGDSTWIRIFFTSMPGYPLDEGVYGGTLRVNSNDPEENVLDLPFELSVILNRVAEGQPLPLRTELRRAWPNPFNPTTMLAFDIAQAGPVTLRVYNLLGQEVARLADGRPLSPGSYELSFNGAQLASGLYVAVLEAAGSRDELKLMLLK
jgi:hypothetical protein